MVVYFPKWFHKKIVAAVDALDKDEVFPVFEHVPTGRHGPTYSWDLDRRRALEHVAFLVGQGFGKGIAQKRVASAMEVSPKTLKDWEREARNDRIFTSNIQSAKKAGESKAQNVGGFVEDSIIGKMLSLESETLSEFGRRYAAKHGDRHPSKGRVP